MLFDDFPFTVTMFEIARKILFLKGSDKFVQ